MMWIVFSPERRECSTGLVGRCTRNRSERVHPSCDGGCATGSAGERVTPLRLRCRPSGSKGLRQGLAIIRDLRVAPQLQFRRLPLSCFPTRPSMLVEHFRLLNPREPIRVAWLPPANRYGSAAFSVADCDVKREGRTCCL